MITLKMTERRAGPSGTFYEVGQTYTLDDGIARLFLERKWADYISGIEVPSVPGNGSSLIALSSNRNSTTADDGSIISNISASNYTLTIVASTTPNGLILQQISSGTCTLVAGAGVTFIGATLATTSVGQTISLIPTSIINTFNVKVS